MRTQRSIAATLSYHSSQKIGTNSNQCEKPQPPTPTPPPPRHKHAYTVNHPKKTAKKTTTLGLIDKESQLETGSQLNNCYC